MKKDELTTEDIERIKELYPNNTDSHLKRVRTLLKKAQPGNRSWNILENDYGFQGDYSPSDHGEPPPGAQW